MSLTPTSQHEGRCDRLPPFCATVRKFTSTKQLGLTNMTDPSSSALLTTGRRLPAVACLLLLAVTATIVVLTVRQDSTTTAESPPSQQQFLQQSRGRRQLSSTINDLTIKYQPTVKRLEQSRETPVSIYHSRTLARVHMSWDVEEIRPCKQAASRHNPKYRRRPHLLCMPLSGSSIISLGCRLDCSSQWLSLVPRQTDHVVGRSFTR
jgi:hypothetical protein